MVDQVTAEFLLRAMNAAKAGNLADAQQIAEQALEGGGDAVALNAFLGMLVARSGDHGGAVAYLERAHHGRPGDTTITCNLIASLIGSGAHERALEVATRERAFSDPSLRTARYRGFLAQALEQYPQAVEAYEHVVANAPDDLASWNNLGNARVELGDAAGGASALERAVALDREAAPTRLNLAAALLSAGRPADAEKVLREAIAAFPQDVRAWQELYALMRIQDRRDEVLAVLKEATCHNPAHVDLHLSLAGEHSFDRHVADAEAAYRRVIALDPASSGAFLGLALQYEHTNRESEFVPLLAEAETASVSDGALHFIRALEHRRAKRFDEGLACLALMPEDMEPERRAHTRGTLFERLGKTDEAFASFQRTNDLHAQSDTQPLVRAAELRSKLSAEIAALTPDWVNSWQAGLASAERPDPVFLVGFPRSGTTLLDTFLMGHPGTTVLEEQPPLNYVDRHIGGFLALPDLNAAGAGDARDRYYREVEKIEPLSPEKMLIDKSPLFLHKAPLIRRLFPDARFILALRHPCDVLLSCFMSNFRLNDAMSNFLRIEDAAEFYDLTFQHWEKSRSLLPLNVHTIHYEQLIEDTPGEVRSLFDYLNLDWHEAALDHTKTAKSRGLITTASYSQVTEPIYKRAAGRWERYRKHLEPVFPVLEPWVTKFGYSL